MKKKRNYYRTAALLGPQTHNVAYRRARPKAVRIPWKMVLPLLGIAAVALWMLLGDAWFLLPENVTVRGVTSTTLKREILITSDLLWWHRLLLKPEAAEARLLSHLPQLKSATVDCALFPTACEITVTERSPALVWIDGAEVYWIDDEGVVFPILEQSLQQQPQDLPVVRGPIPEVAVRAMALTQRAAEIAAEAEAGTANPARSIQISSPDQAAAAALGEGAETIAEASPEEKATQAAAAAAAAASKAAEVFRSVQEGITALDELGLLTDSLEYNAQRGLIWVDEEGRRVAFGVGPDMATRWQMYEALIAHLESEGIFPWTVDVRFPGGITYSLERSW